MTLLKAHLTNAATAVLFVILMCGATKTIASPTKTHHSVKHIHKQVHHSIDRKQHVLRNKVTTRYKATGVASWYGYESGNKTASGTRFNPRALTAAHRTLPFHTKVKVTNLKNHKTVVVTINDRGPYHGKRLIDLSQASAKMIALGGIGKVRVETIN